MTTLLIANNCTRESGSFMGDQLCALKAAYLFVENEPDVDRVIMSVSPGNEIAFVWQKFIDTHKVELVQDTWDTGDWSSRWNAWDKWRTERRIEGISFDHYRELYLRIHGTQRQIALCSAERGLGRRNIYEYWFYGQENKPEECIGSDWYDSTLIYHPPHLPTRDVYISPHAKTQGNVTFTFDYWSDVVRRLVDAGVSVTVGYDGPFCEELHGNPLYRKFWGTHEKWMQEVMRHKIVACGNTGTGWLAAACGVPLLTMEPPNSQMPDHRYRQCGLRNIVEVIDTPNAEYCARRLIEEVQQVVVLTTGCYDILHAGHVRHLERARSLGSKLVVALNSDASIQRLKGSERPINPQGQRKAVLEALRCVDEVRLFDGDDALDVIRDVKPQVLACGYGYTLDTIVGREVVEAYGGRAVVTYYDNAYNEQPSTTKIAKRVKQADIIEVCLVGAGASVNPLDKLKLMAEHLLSVADIPGDIADLGAYRGGTGYVLRRLAPQKQLHLFDTWDGNPHDEEGCHHGKGEWRTSLDDCKSLVGNGALTTYWKGVFPASIAELDPSTVLCFVYVDMDTERATNHAITFFWPRLVRGGKMVFDDYGWHACPGVKRAVDGAFSDDDKCRITEVGHTLIVEKR